VDNPPQSDKRPPIPGPGSLKAAVRKARIESAERSDVVSDLRGAELARLELLQDALSGVLAEVPEGVDLFDTGLVPGDRPRLFIDMLAFIEMAHDRRTYRFQQDTRYGRFKLVESDHLGPVVEAVTTYIARRLVEREKALAADQTLPPMPPAPAAAPSADPEPVTVPPVAASPMPAPQPATPGTIIEQRARKKELHIAYADGLPNAGWPPEQPRNGSLLRGLVNTLAIVVLIMLVGAAVYFAAQEWLRRA
jgi:hypothetical protein